MHKKEVLSIVITGMAIALSIPAWVDVAIASAKSVEYATQNLTPAQVTGIRINSTATGIEVILDSVGQLASPATSVVDNTLIVDIPNAVLALPDSGEFQQANPTEFHWRNASLRSTRKSRGAESTYFRQYFGFRGATCGVC